MMGFFRRLFNKSSATSDPAATKTPAVPVTEEQPSPEKISANNGVVDASEPRMPVPTPIVPAPSVADGATRPLPPEAVISSQNEHITFGQSTDIGLERRNNQDSAFSLLFTSRSSEERPDFGLFIVADGMGGHHDGEKASALTIRAVASHVTKAIYLPLLNQDRTASQFEITEALVEAVQNANGEVIDRVPDGGTTVSAVAIVADLAYVVHVGDSRIYLITKDGVEQITRDHSIVQRYIELDHITREEAADHPQKNVLYRAIGQNEALEVDTLTRRLPPSSRLLLCSDGLWGQVHEKEIFEIVTGSPSPQEACDKLVALANTRGGVDNITTILIKVPSS